MGNASSHRTKTVKGFLDSCKAHITFIPSYLLELAPVEKYFGVLKDLISKDKISQLITGNQKKVLH